MGEIQWTMILFLKHINYIDDICLLTRPIIDPGTMALNLEKMGSSVELKTNTNK